ARDGIEPEELDDPSLDVVIPGELTTAHLLLKLHSPGFEAADERVFDEIMPEVSDGVYDAGLVIHEGRFTYDGYGLEKVLDLGEWWESETGRPVPLGGIVARRDIGVDADDVENAIRRSVEHARDNPEASREYVREHAQEMDDEVIERHIDLYVNDYSIEMGDEGVGAVDELLRRGRDVGALPASDESVLATSDE
ncbi:MAG: MqnA/MqnD/SBP family protein, partial [Halobacteria archaeon]|nr:MqnA/MqnD/SBP family protein [Halobacteria archaeon]